MDIFKDRNAEECVDAMVNLVYQHKGRRHIPESILNRIHDGSSKMDRLSGPVLRDTARLSQRYPPISVKHRAGESEI